MQQKIWQTLLFLVSTISGLLSSFSFLGLASPALIGQLILLVIGIILLTQIWKDKQTRLIYIFAIAHILIGGLQALAGWFVVEGIIEAISAGGIMYLYRRNA